MIYEFMLINQLDLPVLIGKISEEEAAAIRKSPNKRFAEIATTGAIEFMFYGKNFSFTLLYLRDLPRDYYVIDKQVLRHKSSAPNHLEKGVFVYDKGTSAM